MPACRWQLCAVLVTWPVILVTGGVIPVSVAGVGPGKGWRQVVATGPQVCVPGGYCERHGETKNGDVASSRALAVLVRGTRHVAGARRAWRVAWHVGLLGIGEHVRMAGASPGKRRRQGGCVRRP